MTPTEQEKKLREAICKAMHIYPEELQYRLPNSFGESELEAIMQLITADRKRIALEARIDEMDVALAEVTHWSIDDADSAIHGYGEYRIDKLRQEIERIESDE